MSVTFLTSQLSHQLMTRMTRELMIVYSKRERKASFPIFDNDRECFRVPFAYGLEMMRYNSLMNVGSLNRRTSTIEFTGTLRRSQVSVVRECMQQITKTQSVILATYTNSGKSAMACYLISQFKYLAMIVINSTTLEGQWIASLGMFTTAIVMVVGLDRYHFYRGGVEIPPTDQYEVIITMNQRIEKIPTTILEDVSILVSDEAHEACAPGVCQRMLLISPDILIACTATPDRDDPCSEFLYRMAGRNAVIRRWPGIMNFQVIETGIRADAINHQDITSWSDSRTSLYEDPYRNRIIIDLAVTHMTQGRRVNIMVDQIAHAKHLGSLLEQLSVNHTLLIGGTKPKNYRIAPILISIWHKGGTGFDESSYVGDKNIEPIRCLIICFSMKKVYKLTQFMGRLRVMDPIVCWIKDTDKTLSNHLTAAFKAISVMNHIITYKRVVETQQAIVYHDYRRVERLEVVPPPID